MATESVVDQQAQPEDWLEPFRMMDDSIFTGWSMAIADLLACCPEDETAGSTVSQAGHLIYALTEAAEMYRQQKREQQMAVIDSMSEVTA